MANENLSNRKVPIHSQLIALGFLEYYKRIKATGSKLIFPEWKPTRGKASGNAEKWFISFLRDVGLRDDTNGLKIVGMHAFRHTLSNVAKNAGVDESDIVGHSGGESAVAKGYRGDLWLKNKKEIIEKITYDVQFVTPTC